MSVLKYISPIIIGFLLDSIIGDPYWMPHPIRLIGSYIYKLDHLFSNSNLPTYFRGLLIVILVLLPTFFTSYFICLLCYHIHFLIGIIFESILICYMLAAKNLKDESMKVYHALERDDLTGSRKAVSMIVGRDTDQLDSNGIIRAAVETVAENTSDGVTAPLFYIALFGAIGGIMYKAVNTMDSMIGYKNEKYKKLGFFAAKLDDILNYIPSRITAYLMIIVCPILKLDAKNAYRIWKRDRRKHASPNSAQTEAACAGALHVRLAGDTSYFGVLHKKPYIGDDDRDIKPDDICTANKLMYLTSIAMLILAVLFRLLLFGVILS